jgi:hypothetical protein
MFLRKLRDAALGRSPWALAFLWTGIGIEAIFYLVKPHLMQIGVIGLVVGLVPWLLYAIRLPHQHRQGLSEREQAEQKHQEDWLLETTGWAIEHQTIEAFAATMEQIRADVRTGQLDRYSAGEKLGQELEVLRAVFANSDDPSHRLVTQMIDELQPAADNPADYF